MPQRAGDAAAGRDRPADVAGLRVAVVNWRDPWHPSAGGAEQYAWQMAVGLLARGARVWYLTARAPGQSRRERREGVQLVRTGSRLSVYPLVLSWLAAHRRAFDVVLDCQNGIPFFTPWVLPRRVPVVCVMHHVHDAQFGVHFPPLVAAIGRLLEGPVSRWAYRRHECVAVSQSTVAAMRERLGWTGPIHVVPNGLTADYLRCATPPQPGMPEVPVLTWVGRLVAHKRVERVLDVAGRLGDGAVIEVIGRGAVATSLQSEITARGLAGQVRLRGFLPEAAKRAAVAGSLLHLNTSQGEGWGLCVLEAAALGVPTVAYDVDGLRDAVRDGETGWLVRAGQRIEDVAERAVKELSDPVTRAEMAAACRRWASQFDWDTSVSQMARVIADAQRRHE
ncbi:MAG TPA: glycosyltransferase family 4 protein [Streptosporangiaceae bacterium]|nr:glycosyltransferase family 4 protein [Streptosporangiaceae bacterium]